MMMMMERRAVSAISLQFKMKICDILHLSVSDPARPRGTFY